MNSLTFLRHYYKKEIQTALAVSAKDKEVAIKYSQGFGKRPDVLEYANDVREIARKGATSFHVSEEHWTNPLALETGMNKKEVDALRKGWDLVLDIDSPYWSISKITAWLIIEALKEHGIKNISVKFSGNKGWHIGVPFEAFPAKIDQGGAIQEIHLMFPEAPRMIASYLLDYITKNMIRVKENKVFFGARFSTTFEQLKKIQSDELFRNVCARCGKEQEKKKQQKVEFGCASCGDVLVKDAEQKQATKEITGEKNELVVSCEQCGKLMNKLHTQEQSCSCGENRTIKRFNAASIIEVDTLLISQRHLYRAVYSMHEKSGLVSIPVQLDDVLTFDKNRAVPDNVMVAKNPVFLDRSNVKKGQATNLLTKAMAFTKAQEQDKELREKYGSGKYREDKEFEQFQTAAPEELFPPCMQLVLQGMKDGKKRAMFVLINFLASVGWQPDAIEKKLDEWNVKNAEVQEQLRETILKGRLRYHKQQSKTQKPLLPPNCLNKTYYVDMGVCKPDGLCAKIKNPVQYVKKKMWLAQQGEKKERPKRVMSDEQKQRMQAARKQYKEFREMMKKKKAGDVVESA